MAKVPHGNGDTVERVGIHMGMFVRYTALVAAFCAAWTALASTPEATLAVQWHGPTWADPASSFVFTADVDSSDPVTCHYRIGDTTEGTIPSEATGEPNRYQFKIPAKATETDRELRLRLTTATGASAEHVVPFSERYVFDLTGDAAIAIPCPLGNAPAKAVFIPCCTIYGGELIAHVIPVNPKDTAEGLPANAPGPFVLLQPDALVKSTSGLNAQLRYGDPPSPGLVPAVYSFNPRTDTWEPITNPTVDETKKSLTIDCPNGGAFVLGWRKG